MAVPYTRPGITVKEAVSPSVQPLPGEETSVCIIGPAQGFQSYVETIVLDDNTPVNLGATFADLDTLVVTDASDLTADPFVPSTPVNNEDYDIDSSLLTTTGVVSIARSMQTSIPNGESVVAYFENDDPEVIGTSYTENLTLTGVTPAAPTNRTTTTNAASLVVMSPGLLPAADLTITAPGTLSATVQQSGSPTVVQKHQTVVYDYYQTVNETWDIKLDGAPTGGTWDLSFDYGGTVVTATTIAFDADGPTVETAVNSALDTLTGVGASASRVTRTGAGTGGDPYIWKIILQAELAGETMVSVSGDNANLTGGTPVFTETRVTTGDQGPLVSNATVKLNGVTPVALPNDSTGHVFKTQSGTFTDTSVIYDKGTTTDLDYIVSGSGTTLTIARSAGTTTMSPTTDRITVRVEYQATPASYWEPTRVFSQIDAEEKFGPALDAAGEVVSPVSFAAALAFDNGAPNVIIQALFAESGSVRSAPTGVATDWESSLANLRLVENLNVIVPIVSAGGLTSSDTLISAIVSKVRTHIQNMRINQQRYQIAVVGSDSTQFGQGGAAALQSLASGFRGTDDAQHFVVLSPSAFRMANPITGAQMTIGGQYCAAAVAGMLAARAVQAPLTRKVVTSPLAVAETRTPADKDADADAGLTVLESVRGALQVRHAITTDNETVAARELNVVRAKFYHISSMRATLDQLVGTLLADEEAPFSVQLAAVSALEDMRQDGIIVGYDGVQARQVAGDPTHVELRYKYLPAFPLNYITVRFSLNTSTGTVTSESLGV